jgi:hypothetical protein
MYKRIKGSKKMGKKKAPMMREHQGVKKIAF